MKRAGLGALVVLAFSIVAWVLIARPLEPAQAEASPQPIASAAPGGIPFRPPEAFALTVRYVYDGDTIQAQVQTPNEVVTTSNPIRIRLIGVDTPEGMPQPECWADEARAHLAAMLPEGATVWAAPDRDTWDDYQRRLLYLWTDDGRFVNYELVAAGDAAAVRIRPNDAHFDLLGTAEQTARTAEAGRWGACQ